MSTCPRYVLGIVSSQVEVCAAGVVAHSRAEQQSEQLTRPHTKSEVMPWIKPYAAITFRAFVTGEPAISRT